MRIVFMGTPDIASGVLQYILEQKHQVVGVVTVPDKPSGRGQKVNSSAVKKMAELHQIPCLQPEKLKDEEFINELSAFNADVFVVVAFRMLPKVVWSLPPKGTFNLHASLLPQYRGAAPINHALINGETKTGVTTFFINEDIDTGDIIDFAEVDIAADDDAGVLHDKLMNVGAKLVHDTLLMIEQEKVLRRKQMLPLDGVLKMAPKIYKDFCRIDFSKNGEQIRNFVRGLSPYPSAYCELKNNLGELLYLKIFKITLDYSDSELPVGSVFSDSSKVLKIRCVDSWVCVQDLQMLGKKRMPIADFLRGFRNITEFRRV